MKSILNIFIYAFKTIIERKKTLLKVLFAHLALLVLISYMERTSYEEPMYIAIGILEYITYCYIAILTHRIIILGSDSVPKYGVYKPTSREFSFACHFIGFAIISLPILVIFSLYTITHSDNNRFIAISIIWYLFCRISLVFPAIATDKKWSYKDSWYATKNHKLITIVTIAIFPLFLHYLIKFCDNIVNSYIISSCLYSFSTILVVVILSSTYHFIMKEKN